MSFGRSRPTDVAVADSADVPRSMSRTRTGGRSYESYDAEYRKLVGLMWEEPIGSKARRNLETRANEVLGLRNRARRDSTGQRATLWHDIVASIETVTDQGKLTSDCRDDFTAAIFILASHGAQPWAKLIAGDPEGPLTLRREKFGRGATTGQNKDEVYWGDVRISRDFGTFREVIRKGLTKFDLSAPRADEVQNALALATQVGATVVGVVLIATGYGAAAGGAVIAGGTMAAGLIRSNAAKDEAAFAAASQAAGKGVAIDHDYGADVGNAVAAVGSAYADAGGDAGAMDTGALASAGVSLAGAGLAATGNGQYAEVPAFVLRVADSIEANGVQATGESLMRFFLAKGAAEAEAYPYVKSILYAAQQVIAATSG